jgi:hypothetical protein
MCDDKFEITIRGLGDFLTCSTDTAAAMVKPIASFLAVAAAAAYCTQDASCLDNGLALTPPMGWLSWER